MKKLSRILALLLALLLALTCFAEEAAEEITEEPEERVVLMTVGGMPVYQDEAEQIAYLLYYYGNTQEPSLVDGVNYILYYEIAPVLMTEGKLDELLGSDNIEPLKEQLKLDYAKEIENYAATIAGEDADEEAKAAALTEAAAAYTAQGITEESYINDQMALVAFDALLATVNTSVSDEEVQAYYDSIVAEDEAYFSGNAMLYEYYAFVYGYDVFYRPEGYRGVLHILLGADQELLDAYVNAEDDAAKAEAAAAIIAFNQETIDTIYADLDAGATFEEEIAKYNTDPGMTDATNLAEGYAVCAQSVYMVPEFVAGAFAEELQKPGDVGQPVVSDYGVHILYYLKDLLAGALPMSAETADAIAAMLSSAKEQDFIAGGLKQFEIVYFDAYETVVGEENLLDW